MGILALMGLALLSAIGLLVVFQKTLYGRILIIINILSIPIIFISYMREHFFVTNTNDDMNYFLLPLFILLLLNSISAGFKKMCLNKAIMIGDGLFLLFIVVVGIFGISSTIIPYLFVGSILLIANIHFQYLQNKQIT